MNRELLRRRLESFKYRSSTLDEVVDRLRASYKDYSRIKKQPFTTFVRKTLQSLSQESQSRSLQQMNKRKKRQFKPHSPSTPIRGEEEYDVEEEVEASRSTSWMKKRRIVADDRLQRMEDLHVRRMRSGNNQQTTSSDDPSEDDSSSDDEDGAVSTSEDAFYGEKMEPAQFDVTKSNLLSAYMELSSTASKKPETTGVEENVELEVASKRVNKIELADGGRGGEGKEGTELSKGRNGGVEVVKGEEGPRFRDLGGMEMVLKELKMEVIVPLYHPQLPRWLGVRPMAGILLHGPPGCGKTKLAHAIANETGVPFYKISATEVVSGVSGASEENIRDLFSKAYKTAPSIVFIDEIDAIASKRENLQREMERRIVTQLMTSMDESHRLGHPADANSKSEKSEQRPGYVLVIGATNRPDAVDPALRRPGRFDREIALGVPDENARAEILSVLTRNLRLEGSFDILKLARFTPGFVGADLTALANKAGNLAMNRILDERKSHLSAESINEAYNEDWWRQPWLPEEMEKLTITMADFEDAIGLVQPSSRREGFSAIPNVKWDDVGGLDSLRKEFDRYIVRRIRFPEDYERFGVDLETGLLLYGPPGCGKTLIAKAVANEAGANFIHIKGPELLNKYVGESELAVRTLFSRARTCSPCILFFDEVDALTTKRGKEGGWVVERLLNQLLIELDGAEQRRGVFVIGATNRPEVMDPAVLRPGRFGKLLYVPLPSLDERGLILKALGRKKPIDASVDLSAIGRMEACKNLSGADLVALMNEAAMIALEDKPTSTESTPYAAPWTIKMTHFEQALTKISPSVSDEQKQYYKILSESLKAA
ncbi:cell division control protein 48 homolog C-like [Juglans microcarpa x Juglans regia]|uniref:cell division control protein 48 homolog C-like n=1 Tax=Juglans microcarpa x Juglans regia TaxID=2249226 RepID=UPI001B7F3D0A|nr:cell division control protein 48 homolog C-like [Juglans microcarpa x Juglans regia]